MAILLEPSFDKVFSTQEIYRLLLDTMARPGKLRQLPRLTLNPPPGISAAAAAVAFTLLDSDTSFAVLPGNQPVVDYVRVNTAATAVLLEQAEFVIIDGKLPVDIRPVNCGSLLSPERGATLVIMAADIANESDPGIKLGLTGPGISQRRSLTVAGLHTEIIRQIQYLNREFPLGVDVVLSDDAGTVTCIPRSTTIEWEVAGSWAM